MAANYTVSEYQQLFEKAKDARAYYVPEWALNISYIAGQQWVYWNGGRIDMPYIDPNRTLVTDNRMRPVCEARAARKTKNRPSYTGTPTTGDDADIEAARIGEKVLESDWLALDLQQKLFTAIMWAEIGDGFWKIFWDGTKGDKVQVLFGPDGQPLTKDNGTPFRAEEVGQITDPQLLQHVQVKEIAQGDVCVEVISPFELFPDPLATSMEDIEWMIEEKVRSTEYVKRRYPNKIDGEPFTPTEDADVPLGTAEGMMFTAQMFAGSTTSYRGVKVYEYWCKPNTQHPNGKRVVWANDTLLVDEEPFDPMPYVMFTSSRVPGRFWSRSVASDLRGPQEDLNKIRTQILENAKRLGNPSLMSSTQSGVEVHGVPGEHIKWDAAFPDSKPEYLEPPRIPPYVENEIERILKSIEEISGMHEVSRATVPPGVTAASAINLLQEADDTRIGPEIQSMERSLEIAGTKDLKLRARFNTDERTIRLAGEDGDWDIFAFKGAMLGETPQVEVQAGSSMPRSKAAKQAQMNETLGMMMQYGMPPNPRALRKFFKDYEVGGLERLFESISNDEQQVTREHRQMTNGEPVNLHAYDDDAYHLEAHTSFQKSSRYEGLPPPIQALIEQHVQMHRARMVQVTNLQLAQEQKGQQQQLQQETQSTITEHQAKEQAKAKAQGANQSGTPPKQ